MGVKCERVLYALKGKMGLWILQGLICSPVLAVPLKKSRRKPSLLAVLLRMKADKGPRRRSPTFLLAILGQILLSLTQRDDFISDF